MRLLFSLDTKEYNPAGVAFVRPSARGIIIRGGRVAMVYSRLYDYYKFPGGGIEPDETHAQALRREVAEEVGLQVIPASIRPYGLVHRVQKDERVDIFIQDNYYYLCEAAAEPLPQRLDGYEAAEGFTLVWADPHAAIRANRTPGHGPKDPVMLEREARVLETLLREGYFKQEPTAVHGGEAAMNETIRLATPDDHDWIFALKAACVRPYAEKIWGWDEEWQKKDFDHDFAAIEQFRVIEADGRPAGFIQCVCGALVCEVVEIHLFPTFRGRGIGSRILRRLQKACTASGRKIRIGCFQENHRARALYQRLGFVQVKETATHYVLEYY